MNVAIGNATDHEKDFDPVAALYMALESILGKPVSGRS